MARFRSRGRGRQTKVWVPFEATRSVLTAGANSHDIDNEHMQIAGVPDSDRGSLQAPFSHLTSGDPDATNLEHQTARVARPCTILAVSCSSYIDRSSSTPSALFWCGLGIIPSSASTTSIEDLPEVMSSQAPGIWPYVSPHGAAPSNSGFSVMQKGKRKLQPGWLLYTSVAEYNPSSANDGGSNVHVQFRVLFGLD